MSTKASSPATPVMEHGKHRDKSDKKRRHEESAGDSVTRKTKRQKKHDEEVNNIDAVRRSDKEEKADKKDKEKKDKKDKKEKKNKKQSLEPSSPPTLKADEPQANGLALDHLPDASQVTLPEPITNGKGDAGEDEDVELPDAPDDDAPEITEDPAESVTTAEAPLTLEDQSLGVDLLNSPDPSSFYSTRISLYLPIPAITLPHHAIGALLSRHIAPLLLTYFPPVKGTVLAFQDPVLSANASPGVNHALKQPTDDQFHASEDDASSVKQVLAQASDQQGVAWVWLTVTFLVFNPQRGDELYGVNNVASEGFVGLVSYNYFQISVGAKRIPGHWKWRGPETNQGRKQTRRSKAKMDQDGRWSQSSPVPADPSQSSVADERSRAELESETGFYLESGEKVENVIKVTVVDTDMVAGSRKGEWALHIDGTLLDEEAEKAVREEEIQAWERQHHRHGTPGIEMSGAVATSREGSAAVANRRL
ncbi:hypothetical protein DV738_g4862, partial [Chaetothyriales sp. CBS 135597]